MLDGDSKSSSPAMAASSNKPQSWGQLAASARAASAPQGIDLRAAIRAEISSKPAVSLQPSLIDDVLGLFQARWLQGGLAVLAVVAFFSCWQSLDVAHEIAWIWELQGPVLLGI